MSELKIAGNPLPGMPWEERPEGCKNVMWRCSANPIIPRDLLPTSNSIFNSAVVPFGEGYAGVFRCDDTNRRMALHVGFSKDAVHWDINPEKLQFQCDIPEIGEWVYGYDPRVCFIDDRYYVTWCNGYKGQTIRRHGNCSCDGTGIDCAGVANERGCGKGNSKEPRIV